MKKEEIKHAIEQLRKNSKKRRFNQTVDLVINFKEIDKKHNVDVQTNLPFDTGKGVKVCAVVETDLEKKAKEAADFVITKNNLSSLNTKEISKIAKEYDIFIAQSSLMGQMATVFGRILGPLGKMPNPRAGGVLMPDTNISATVLRFKKGLRIKNKNEPCVKIIIGKEDFDDNKLIENVTTAYEAVVSHLPNTEGNVKNTLLKFTMSRPVRIGKIAVTAGDKDARKK
ncbi:hypothetical protein HYT56_00890 [Candidatus Woesearchaeota archaeon]|nr:hypothetical protein [Candidatus Woesearchaeota archaeon]